MSISKEEVRHVAALARLSLTEQEVEDFAGQLSRVLEAAERLQAVDVDSVPPTLHVLSLQNVMREDEEEACLPREQALGNAPEQDGVFFLVPKVVGTGGDGE